MWNIEKHLIIDLVFAATSVNTGIHKGVTACPEKSVWQFLATSMPTSCARTVMWSSCIFSL